MNGEVIKSFLVGLGFGVDEASLAQFNKAIAGATLKVAALYGSIKIASAGIVYGLSKISEGFEQMGYEYRLIAPAINKALQLRRELLKAYSAAGINIGKVIQDSIKLNFSLTKTKYAFEALYKSVASRFFVLLTQQSDNFRKKLYANMPKIQEALERFVKFIFKAFEATLVLGARLWSILGRVYDFFVQLDKATEGWSTIVIGLIAAWKLLNLSFLATPLGAIIAGLVTILALFDDFKTWQEGGVSFFDWTRFVPVVNAYTEVLKSLWEVLSGVTQTVLFLYQAFWKLFNSDFAGFLNAWGRAGEALISVFKNLGEMIFNQVKALGSVFTWGSGFLNNANTAANLQNTPQGVPQGAPIGSQAQNSLTNQNVQQQTNINVSGAPDASAVGRVVSGEQSRVNFDMVRNLKGATR